MDPCIWTAQSQRYASTSTQPSPKSVYGRADAPPPAKTSKTTVPAKTSANRTVSPPAKTNQTPQVPILKAKANLNPPDSTYAPDLTLPTRASDQGFISYIWKCGRTYLTFYKTGVSNVRSTSKLARSLRAKAGPTGTVDYTSVLTRAEWQIVRRSRLDMLRLPAFGVIFLVFGEWTPLLVRWITPLIPEPCRIPSQVSRDLEKAERKRKDRLHKLDPARVMRLVEKDRPKPGVTMEAVGARVDDKSVDAEALRDIEVGGLRYLDAYVLACRFDAYAREWDWVGITPPKRLLQRNLKKKFEYLKKDDELIQRDGGWAALEKREVESACRERGLDVLGKKEEELRRSLATWYGSKR
jgi:hypothetical protein